MSCKTQATQANFMHAFISIFNAAVFAHVILSIDLKCERLIITKDFLIISFFMSIHVFITRTKYNKNTALCF